MDSPIFFQCVVIDNQDPLMLGRVRARIRTENYEDIIKSVENWNPEKDPWTARDPLIFNPLLPYFLYQVPENEELVQVIYVNKDFKYQNQYYVQNAFYSPNSVFNIYNVGGDKFTGTGMQYKSPKPIRNQDGTFANRFAEGLYPLPGDNGLLGRGNADIIVKKTDTLIRAGKYSAQPQSNIEFAGNVNRAFLQLSIFDSIKKKSQPKTYFQITTPTIQVKYLIEWVITNPENTVDKFCGSVYLYQLKPDVKTNSKELTVSSVVPENLKSVIAIENFFSLPISGATSVVSFINTFIKTCNDQLISTTGKRLFYTENKFPIYFRPNNTTYSYLNPSVPNSALSNTPSALCPPGQLDAIQKNMTAIFNNIKLNPNDSGGYGLIWKSNTVGTPEKIEKQTVVSDLYVSASTTINAMGADYLFLLSHKSALFNKQPINLDGTLYGISGDTFFDEILPKTSSTVRGEELIELLNLIVRFLITHTHAYPGLPPATVTQDGSTVEQILTELQNAYTKILNNYIRLN